MHQLEFNIIFSCAFTSRTRKGGWAIVFGLIPNEKILVKYLLTVLNSKLINYYHTFKFLDIEKRLFQKLLIENCKKLPVKIIPKESQLPFIAKADIMLSKNKELQELKHQLLQLLQGKYEGLTLTKKTTGLANNFF